MTAAPAATGADSVERLYLPGASAVHRLPAAAKIVAAVAFVLVVVATPAAAWWAFLWYAVLIVAVAVRAGLPLARVLRRMAIEVPFVVFALFLPFVGRAPFVDVLGVELSEPGLLAAWTILVKGTLGVATSVVLGATTRAHDIIGGLSLLRVPSIMVEIAAFMLRYIDVVGAQWRRMTLARAARGSGGTGLGDLGTVARSAGVLFIRAYERGERVHLAMASRGYDGRMPDLGSAPIMARQWLAAGLLPGAAAAGALMAAVVAGAA